VSNKKLLIAAWASAFVVAARLPWWSLHHGQAAPPVAEVEVDVGREALAISKQLYPDLDVDTYDTLLDMLVERVRTITAGETDPDKRIRAMNTVIYKLEGYKYDKDAYKAHADDCRLLSYILQRRTGTCMALATLYLATAQRLGYPIYSVSAPSHMFLRYIGPDLQMRNIEPTDGGGESSDDDYDSFLKILYTTRRTGVYMRTMSHQQFVSYLYSTAIPVALAHRNGEQAMDFVEKALALDPHNTVAMARGAVFYRKLARVNYQKNGAAYGRRASTLAWMLSQSGDEQAEKEMMENLK